MDTIKIHGGVALQGKVRIQGSKNASLPILAAILMTEGETVLYNVPKISDVNNMCRILAAMGRRIRFFDHEIRISKSECCQKKLPNEAVTGMRSSMYLMGVLLGNAEKISMQYPGGCVIGARPMDIHLKALEKMGAHFKICQNQIEGEVSKRLHGADISLPFPSVGATENVILAAVRADGRTCIQGAAREPEVTSLCQFLNCCGACITGIGTDTIVIHGVKRLHGCHFRIPGDRIVAGTYMIMTAVTGGCAFLEDTPADEMEAVMYLLCQAGCEFHRTAEGVFMQAPEQMQPIREIATKVYPGFPTDLQSLAMVMTLKMPGITTVRETIFEDRFQIVPQLQAMGAKICLENNRLAYVSGGRNLSGCFVEAKELRGGAALIAAGLSVNGVTTVSGGRFIDRGYENICKDLRELGARIYRDK